MGSRFGERVEHGLQIESRAADHLEHVGGGGLLLQRFAQLVEQPRVLDGDDRLRGEVLQQFDLLVGERAHLLAIDGDRSNQLFLFEHWNEKKAAGTASIRKLNEGWRTVEIGFLRPDVGNVNNLPRVSDTPKGEVRAGVNDRFTTPLFDM